MIRVTPSLHLVGTLPPIPTAGTTIPMATGSGSADARVVLSDGSVLVFDISGKRWSATPLRPSEVDLIGTYPEGSGATDWVIRLGA